MKPTVQGYLSRHKRGTLPDALKSAVEAGEIAPEATVTLGHGEPLATGNTKLARALRKAGEGSRFYLGAPMKYAKQGQVFAVVHPPKTRKSKP